MGQDKSLLEYHGRAQRYHVADMLRPFCDEVYLSLNASQTEETPGYRVIRDAPGFANGGPMTALLSAYRTHKNILLIGCDYPLLTREELARFIDSIVNSDVPKVFYNEAEQCYEPLLGFYGGVFFHDLLSHFRNGGSLQRLLTEIACDRYLPLNKDVMRSVDDKKGSKVIGEIIAAQKKTKHQ